MNIGEAKFKDFNEKITKLCLEKDKIERNIAEKADRLDALDEKLHSKENERRTTDAEVEALHDKKRKLSSDLSHIRDKITAVEARCQAVEEDFDDMVEARDSLFVELSELKTEYDDLLREKTTTLKEVTTVEDEKTALREQVEALSGQKNRLIEEVEQLDLNRAHLRRPLEKLDEELRLYEERLDKRKDRLNEREETVLKMQSRAEEAVRIAKQEAYELRGSAERQIAEDRLMWEDQRSKRLAELQETYLEKLKEERADLEEEKQKLKEEQLRVKDEQAEFQEDKKFLKRSIERRVESEVASERRELEMLQQRYALLKNEREENLSKIAELQHLQEKYEGRDLSALDEELRIVGQRAEELRAELSSRPTASEAKELRELRKKNNSLSRELDKARQRVQRLELDDLAESLSKAQVQELKRAAEHWETMYQEADEKLAALLEQVNRGRARASAFPRLEALDEDDNLKLEPSNVIQSTPSTANLIDLIKTSLSGFNLSYDGETLASYLAGMAMSRLIILEGPPGTGKTTLGEYFAKALGAGSTTIKVQAGWRDRQDLVGHYNTFERQYHETEFLEALYRAHTPRYRHSPYFIVLDEANLSRPEYYFADFLVAIERQARQIEDGVADDNIQLPSIALLNKPLSAYESAGNGEENRVYSRIPEYLRPSKGTKILLPSNVWFVATANNDESTYTPAPKTYGRAHVQRLNTVKWNANDNKYGGAYKVVTNEVLKNVFNKAYEKYRHETEYAEDILKGIQNDTEKLDLGITHRLIRQARRYISVYVAAMDGRSNSIDEALDHLLVTKVLKGMSGGMYDNRSEYLDEILSELEDSENMKLSRARERISELSESF